MSVPNPATTDWVPLWAAGPVAGYVPAARVYHNAAQAIANGAAVALAFNSEQFDTDNIHDTVTANSRLVCKTAGLYLITASFEWAANATGNRQSILKLNGTTDIARDMRPNNGAAGTTEVTLSCIYQLAVNDYVEIYVVHDAGVSLNINQGNFWTPSFSMTYIGPNVALGAVIPPTYGTTLPASPADGQEAILVDSITNPTWQWRFRYNAGSASAYKWEFIGGAPFMSNAVYGAAVNTLAQVGATGWYYHPNISMTLPRAGDYEISGVVVFDPNTLALGSYSAAIFTGASIVAYSAASSYNNANVAAGQNQSVNPLYRVGGQSAGALIGIALQTAGITGNKFAQGWVRVIPIRVS